MGNGPTWSNAAYKSLHASNNYRSATRDQIFTQTKEKRIHSLMSPYGIKQRESRDSAEHPLTIAIMVMCDHTGSMGRIPEDFVRDSMPMMMQDIVDLKVVDPQLFFGAVGDHYTDQAPLQIGQFESSAELINKWLTSVYLEGNGGGNGGESYPLAWYFAGYHTSIDCWEKRGQKGYLFTIGDEPFHQLIEGSALKSIMGSNDIDYSKDYSAEALLTKAKEKYHVYHIHVDHGYGVDGRWKKLLGENLLVVNDYRDIASLIGKTVNAVQSQLPTPAHAVVTTAIAMPDTDDEDQEHASAVEDQEILL